MSRPSKGKLTGTEGDLSVRMPTWEKRFKWSTRHRGNDPNCSILTPGTLISQSGQKTILSSVSFSSIAKRARHSSIRQDFVHGIGREISLNASVVLLSLPQSPHRNVDLKKPRKRSFMMEPSWALKTSSVSKPSSVCNGALLSSVWRPSNKMKAAYWASCCRQLNISMKMILIR